MEPSNYTAEQSNNSPKYGRFTASKSGAGGPSKTELEKRKVQAALQALEGIDDHGWNDTGMADRVHSRHGHKMRYVTEEKIPYVYMPEQGIWKSDPQYRVMQRLIEETILWSINDTALKIEDLEARGKYLVYLQLSLSRRTRGDALHILLTKIASVSVDDFDADPWVLCTKNGLINLKTSQLVPHKPDALCSKRIDIDYEPAAVCPQFMEFIRWTMCGGENATAEARVHAEKMVEFLQRLFGCCATGVFEKMIVFFHGKKGDNGKSVLLDTVRAALGPYSDQLQIDALTASRGEVSNNINSNLMKLRGIRMAVSNEPEEDRPMNISRIKYMTSGGKIMARSLRMDPVEYVVRFKPLVELNHLLKISNADDPVWNRVWAISFNAQVQGDEKDPNLREKLRSESELPGILAWIVRGAAWYAASGLQFPDEMKAVTQGYRVSSDHFPMFIEDSIVSSPESCVAVKQLWSTYEQWIHNNAETQLNRQQFKSRLQSMGFYQGRATINGKQDRAWMGMKLICKTSGPGLISGSLR